LALPLVTGCAWASSRAVIGARAAVTAQAAIVTGRDTLAVGLIQGPGLLDETHP
jgi:hypothetical protein